MPQLDYACLKNYIKPSQNQLNYLYLSTRHLFNKYDFIPFYFVNIIGSLVFLNEELNRYVINLHPNGKYDIYDTFSESLQYTHKLKEYALKHQRSSNTCKKCEWIDACKFHEGGRIQYDWCDLRKTLFNGIFDGLIKI